MKFDKRIPTTKMGTYTIENVEDVCRLCAVNHEHMKPIYINQCIQHNLELLIQKLLPFIELNANDILPNRICVNCTSTLIVFNNFWEASRIANENFKLLIIDSENKLIVKEENDKRLNDYENSLHFFTNENSNDFTPTEPFVQLLTTDIEDQNSYKTTAINDYKEKMIDEADILSVPEAVSNTKSARGGSGPAENSAAANSPILLNALTQSPAEQVVGADGPAATSAWAEHSYSLASRSAPCPAAVPKRSPRPGTADVSRGVLQDESRGVLQDDHTYAMRGARRGPDGRATTESGRPPGAADHDDGTAAPRSASSCARRKRPGPPEPSTGARGPGPGRGPAGHSDEGRRAAAAEDARSSLDRFRVVLQDGARRYYKCDRCPYYTQTQRSAEACFTRHYGQHAAAGSVVECGRCARTFRTAAAMRSHVAVVHHGVKNHECRHCGKRFAASSTLKTHLLMHAGERPYACDECGSAFRHPTKLKKHRLFVHRKQRSHRCPVCDKPYFTANQVRMHMKRHTGVRDNVCDVCGKAYLTKKTLTEHAKMVHGGPGKFVCAACGKAYKTKRNMVIHRETTHDRPAAAAAAAQCVRAGDADAPGQQR